MPPLTQDDIRQHYEQEWKTKSNGAADGSHLSYSNPVEDAVLYPIYERLIRDLAIKADGGRILDVGSGSGRWARFFLDRFNPAALVGIDYALASVELLRKWCETTMACEVRFEHADITSPQLDLALIGRDFDLINIANVLFHIPEPDRFTSALRNMATLIAPDGRIVTTEYLPRATMRTNWMLVRSRYEFEAAVHSAGLRIIDIRAACFFANDSMGLDGPDQAGRGQFHRVRTGMQALLAGTRDDRSRASLIAWLADLERCLLAYCGERVAQVDLPSQKLVVLARV